MKEHEDIYMAVVQTHTLDGASTVTLMKPQIYICDSSKGTRMNGAITVLIIYYCDDFQ